MSRSMSQKFRNHWVLSHRGKIVHKRWLSAAWHVFRLRLKGPDAMNIYPCFWEDQWQTHYDGHSARRHWHVGHKISRHLRRRM